MKALLSFAGMIVQIFSLYMFLTAMGQRGKNDAKEAEIHHSH